MDFCQSSCKGGAACVPCVRVRASLCVSGRVCASVSARARARACVCAGVRALRQFFSPEAWGSPPERRLARLGGPRLRRLGGPAAQRSASAGGSRAAGVRGRGRGRGRGVEIGPPFGTARVAEQFHLLDRRTCPGAPPAARRAGRGSHRPCAPGASAALRSCAPGQRLWRPPAPRPPCMSRGHGRLRKVQLNEAELGPAGV